MDKDNLVCPICGKPTANYYGNYNKFGLCNEHSRQQKNGEIEQCPDCGKWHDADEYCDCEEEDDDESFCIICGKKSNGYFFCKECYYKYKNKEILVKINKCELPCGDPLDESYEGVYECDDGHIVKSQAERDIDNYLFENGIFHGYELPIDVGTDKPLKPDFCLKNYLGKDKDLYIEYFGYTNDPQYDERTAYKIPLYKKAGITLVCMYAKTDLKNIKFALKQKLNKKNIIENKINFLKENE